MPTNLPPEYTKVEQRFRQARDPEEKADLLEEMLSIIPKHKGTDHLRADLRRKLAKLRDTGAKAKGGSRQTSAFHIDREGAGQVVLLGPPNVGKSALVSAVTNARPEVAEYAMATWTPTPGMMEFEHVQIQLVDTPSINPDYVEPEMVNLIRRADLIAVMIDLQGFPIEQLEESIAYLQERRFEPYVGEPPEDTPGITHKPLLVIVNKVDDERFDEDFDVLCELIEGNRSLIPISVNARRNLDGLGRAIFDALRIIRVYSKPPGESADLTAPFVLPIGSTVEEFAASVHRDFVDNLKSARLWGSAQFDGQMVARDYVLQDGDIVELRM
ncbi:MAG: TGS domain-containing protein [Chloroflexi bacterium]|nr:TGS domain-containing protein [Chloroflexota bacterium]